MLQSDPMLQSTRTPRYADLVLRLTRTRIAPWDLIRAPPWRRRCG